MELFLTSVWGPESSAEIAKAAEDLGFTHVWLAEHHNTTYGRCTDAVALASSILDATSTLHVGTAIVPFTYWPARELIAAVQELPRFTHRAGQGNPSKAAVLPQRFTLGVGRGTPSEAAVPPRHDEPFDSWLRTISAAIAGVKVAAVSDATIGLASSLGLSLLLGKENDDAMVAGKLRVWGSGGDHVRLVLPSQVDAQWLAVWQGPEMAARLLGFGEAYLVPRKMLLIEAAGQSGVMAALSAVRTEG